MMNDRFKAQYLLPVVVLALFGLLVGVLELAVRRRHPGLLMQSIVGAATSLRVDHRLYIVDPRFGRWHRRSFSGSWKGMDYTTNTKGIRDTETPYGRTPNRRRVLVVGDSVVWGQYVDDGETFSDLLEHSLPDTEVINLGVTGYGTGEELRVLKKEGLKYHPDLVALVVCVRNDVQNTYFPDGAETHPTNLYYLKNGALKMRKFRLNLAQWAGIALRENSYLVNFLLRAMLARSRGGEEVQADESAPSRTNAVEAMNRRTLAWIEQVRDREGFDRLTYLALEGVPADAPVYGTERLLAPTPENYYKVELTKHILLEMAQVVRASGAEFAVVLSPFKAQLDPSEAHYDVYRRNPLNDELMRFLQAEGIHAVDLLPLFVQRGVNPDQLFLDSVHYTPWGHAQVAELLRQTLIARPARASSAPSRNEDGTDGPG